MGLCLPHLWSFSFPVRRGRASGACLALGAEPRVVGTIGPGSEGVLSPASWRVSVTGRVHSASPRVASCAWDKGCHGLKLVGGGGEAAQGLAWPRLGSARPGGSFGVDR